jgi:HSP20 family molecular chaperone IbpA
MPCVDIYAGDKYIIYLEVPGITKDQIVIYRSNVVTVVKGTKERPAEEPTKTLKNERRYGDFTLTFKIPEIYERKWKEYYLEDGVMKIVYEKDADDSIQSTSNTTDNSAAAAEDNSNLS